MRVGEATNPGPHRGGPEGAISHDAATYRDPMQIGFRHAVLPAPEGQAAVRGEDMAHYSLVIDTVNGTSWGPLARYLQRACADVLLCQEHHLGPADVPAASALALRLGWHSIFIPAAPGEGGGWRGGVAVLTRAHIGMSAPRVGTFEVIPARVLAVLIEAPGYRPFTAVTAYLEHGQGLGDRNMQIMEEIGMFLEAQGTGVPFVLGGDLQNDPSELARLGFATRTSATIVASRDPRGTCRSSTATSELDYFIVHNHMAGGVESVAAVEGAGTAPHVPVRLRFKPKLAAMRTLVLRKPPPMNLERIVGPVPQPPDWSALASRFAELAAHVQRDDFRPNDEFRRTFGSLYEQWADIAEVEIADATTFDYDDKKYGLRGRAPVMVWRSLQAERPPSLPRHHVELDRWRTFASIINEIRGVILWMLMPTQSRDREMLNTSDGNCPIPQGLRADLADELIAKLKAIREQLDVDQCAHAEAADVTNDGADGQDDGDVEPAVSLHEMNQRLHALACATQLAVDSRFAQRRSGEEHADDSALPNRLVGQADRLQELVQGRLKRATVTHRAALREGWRSWVLENIANGAKNAHKYLRLPTEWRPTTSITIDGVVTADPARLLQGYATKYDALWNGAERRRRAEGAAGLLVRGEGGGDGDRGDDDATVTDPPWRTTRTSPLSRPTPADIRAASRAFKHCTATAYDGIPMRAYDLLSDPALEIVADMFTILEVTGELPLQLQLTEMPMIPKPKGGHRAIATMVGLYRLWAKLRKPIVTQWEMQNDRPYLAAGKGRSPHSSVWRQACHAEAAVDKGFHSATLLWDLMSFFEAVRRVPLWHRAKRLGFPLPLLKVALGAYSSARVLSLGGLLSAPIPAADGVLAGCGLAMALTRAYVLGPMDAVMANLGPSSPLPARVDMYVDDLAVAAEGTMGQVVARLANAAELLQEAVEGPLHCQIELGKAAVVSSSKALTDILRNRFGKLAGGDDAPQETCAGGQDRRCSGAPPRRRPAKVIRKNRKGTAAPNLGIDYAAGQKRGSHGRGSRRAQRLARLGIKTARLARIRAIAGRRTPLIFLAGPLPEATYGASVNGLSDKEVLTIRRNAAQAYSPRARGRSLSRLMLLVGIPTWRAEVEVILEYARQVWQASLLGATVPCDGTLTLPQLSRLWHAVGTNDILTHNGTRRNWSAVRGPIGAMWLSLHRLGWTMKGPFTIINHDKEDLALTTTSPAMLAQLLRQAVVRALQLQVGEKLAMTDEAFRGRRVAVEHVAAQLKCDRRLCAKDRAAYMSVACGAVMTHSRAVAEGYLISDYCPLCGLPGDTIGHRIWRCRHHAVVQAREAAAPSWFLREADRAADVERSTFWSTGFIPHPVDTWPAPAATADMIYEWVEADGMTDGDRSGTGDPLLSGSLYVDGSCSTHVFPELRRAATSVVQWAHDRQGGWRMQLPVPSPLPQSPQAAEYSAMVLVRRYAHPARSSSVASDCSNVVRDLNLPPRAALDGRKMYAGMMREVVTDDDWAKRTLVRKVPAHVNPTSLPPGQARADAIGNDAADKLAKDAVSLHPAPTPAMRQELEALLTRARIVVRTIAAVTQCFPPMARERMARPPPSVEGARVNVGTGHRWVFTSGMWRCEACLRMTTKSQIDAALALERCHGQRPTMNIHAMAQRGHALARTDGLFPVVFCVRCGAWSTRRAYGLAAACRGTPAPSGRQALARIARGYQPWEDRHVSDGNKRGKGLRCRSRWSADRKAFVAGNAAPRTRAPPTVDPADAGGLRRAPGRVGEVVTGPAAREEAEIDCMDDDLPFPEGDDEDVFGHGGQLDQDEPMDMEAAPRREDGAEAQAEPLAGLGAADQAADNVAYGIGLHAADAGDDGSGGADERSLGQSATNIISPMSNGGSTEARSSRDGTTQCDDVCQRRHPNVGEGHRRVKAKRAVYSVAVAREGPGGPEPGCSTATAAVSTAEVAVAPGEEATILSHVVHAPCHRGSGGEVAGPPDGPAAPSEDSSSGTDPPHGHVYAPSSQAMPMSVSGERPRWRSLNSPLRAPTTSSAGLHHGDALSNGDGDPPPPKGKARRRVGSGDPAACPLAARRGTDAAGARCAAQPQGGCEDRPRPSGARGHGCRRNAQSLERCDRAVESDAADSGQQGLHRLSHATESGTPVGQADASPRGTNEATESRERVRRPAKRRRLAAEQRARQCTTGAAGLAAAHSPQDVGSATTDLDGATPNGASDAGHSTSVLHRHADPGDDLDGARHFRGSPPGLGVHAPHLDPPRLDRGLREADVRPSHDADGPPSRGESHGHHQRRHGGKPTAADVVHPLSHQRAPRDRDSPCRMTDGALGGECRSAGSGDGCCPSAAAHLVRDPCVVERLGADLRDRGEDEGGRGALGEGIPIWMRPPAWLYLPHLDELGAGAARPGAHGDERDEHRRDGCGAIRGQPPLPGAQPDTVTGCGRGSSGGAACSATIIRGLNCEPGPRPAPLRDRAQQLLEARHSGLEQSLADHAERVSRRRAREPVPGTQTSAIERMAALHRRVAERASRTLTARGHDPRGNGELNGGMGSSGAAEGCDDALRCQQVCAVGPRGIGTKLEASSGPASIEDVKMHSIHVSHVHDATASTGQQAATADVTSSAAAAVGGGGGPNLAAANAAAAWARHALGLAGAGGEAGHLSAA